MLFLRLPLIGYIGKAVVREAVRRGYPTTAVVRDATRATSEPKFAGASVVQADVTQEQAPGPGLDELKARLAAFATEVAA